MAIVYSYPGATPTLSDTVLGTQFDYDGNATKSFLISDIIALATTGQFVPYIGANQNVNLGSFNLTANSIIKAGGTNLQFLMADGSVTTGGVTSVTGTSPIVSSGGTTPAISIPLGTSSVDGYLSATDRTNFETAYTNRITSLTTTGTGAATLIANVLNIPTPSLSGFVPYTGATQAVNLGAFNLTVNNVSVGRGAGTGIDNTAIGTSALSSNTTGGSNVAIGYLALATSTSGNGNVAIGYKALTTSSSSTNNTAIGFSSGEFTTTGYHNVFLGWYSGRANTTGIENTFLGYQGGSFNTTGSGNTLVGFYASRLSTTASQNASLGYQSLGINTTGSFNSVVGYQALQYATTGQANVAIGWNAGSTHTGGGGVANNPSNSIYIGYDTKSPLNNQTNQIVIGFGAIGAGSNTATLGNTSITTTRLRGAVQGGSFVKDGGTSSQYLMADGSVTTGYTYNFSGSLTLTGTLTTTNLLTITIPANSLSDYLDLRSIMVQQSGPALAGFQIRVWHNSVNDFNTATRIANYAFGAGGADLFAQMTRKFSIQGGTLFGFPSTPSSITGEGSNSNAALSIAFDTTVVNYLFVSVQLTNATDTATLRNVNITT